MAEKQNTPEIRFKGFTDPWEQRKFSDIADVCSGKDYKHLKEGPIPVYGTGGFMTSVDEALSYDRDAVGIGRKGTIDKPYLLKAPFWTVDTLFYAIPKEDMDLEFVHCSFLNVDWKSKDESTGLPSLSKEAINETIALVPSFNEQSRLGEFFNNLDSLITLHQRKHDKLCTVKRSMLDKMFPKPGETEPEIRFKGFTDPWEQRKLGGIAPVTMGQSPNGACYTDNPNDAVLVQGNADLKDGWVFPRVWTTEITKTAKAGDLIMSVRAPVGAMGKTAYDVVLGRGVAGIAGNEFLFQALSKKEAEGYWSTVSAGSTFDSINGDELRNTPVDYPRSKPEREAVGSCLSRIDCLITLHQRKCEYRSLCGYLSWEQRKLGEVAHRVIRKNEGNQSDLPLTISAQHGLVDQRDYFNNQVASRDMSGYYLLENGEFAYNKSTSGDSPWGAIKRLTKYEKGCLSTLYICFGLDLGDPDFLVTYYETNRWHGAVQMIAAEGARNHGLLNIAPDDFFETVLTLPCSTEEQKQIGCFFTQLNSLITLHQ